MSYKLCDKCKFRVPSPDRLCHVCGASSFTPLIEVSDDSAYFMTSDGFIQWLLLKGRSYFTNLFSGLRESGTHAGPKFARTKQFGPDRSAGIDDRLARLRKLREQELERLRILFNEYEVDKAR